MVSIILLAAQSTVLDLLLSPGGLTVSAMLLAAVIALWRINLSYSNKVHKDAEQARKDLIATLNASHEETQALLTKQNALLAEQVESYKKQYKDEKALREIEWKEHHGYLLEITTKYSKSLDEFTYSMKKVQQVLEQVLAEIREKK